MSFLRKILFGDNNNNTNAATTTEAAAAPEASASASAAEDSTPSHHVVKKGSLVSFTNPWDTWEDMTFKKGYEFFRTRKHPEVPTEQMLQMRFPVERPDLEQLRNPKAGDAQVTWLGHASFLIQMDGLNVLTDPIWSKHCSPFQGLGPRRVVPPPLSIEDLPEIHMVLISHNHYDHLDATTISELENRFRPRYLVPLGLQDFFTCETSRVKTMDWWEEVTFNQTRFVFVPAQHWSTRKGFLDRNRSLWGGWLLASPNKKVYFSGDTGYCPVFKEIGSRFGPIDLSLLPLGAYCPRCVMRPQHCDPAESVDVHRLIKSRLSLGMHWGTFILSNEPFFDPPCRLLKELALKGVSRDEFFVSRIGKVLSVDELLTKGTGHVWKDFGWANADDAHLDES